MNIMLNKEKELQNKKYWNELVDIHFLDSQYQVNDFENGGSTLRLIERNLLSISKNTKLLHLQCHFGLDTMSIARDYNINTYGIDFSEKSILIAQQLSQKNNINSVFCCSNAYDYPHLFKKNKFDIVFASYGILTWISDLRRWMKAIVDVLKKGGEFVLIDEHPFAATFGGQDYGGKIEIKYPYKFTEKGYKTYNKHSYINQNHILQNQIQYKWPHSISEIINMLYEFGFKISEFNEYEFSFYKAITDMEIRSDGYWYPLSESLDLSIPYTFAIKSVKI